MLIQDNSRDIFDDSFEPIPMKKNQLVNSKSTSLLKIEDRL